MQKGNIIPNHSETVISYSVLPGVEITVARDSLADYLSARAAHLASVNALMMSGDFESWDESTKSDLRWLASMLASEVSKLASVVRIRENLE